MTDYEKGKQQYNQMRFGCISTVALIIIAILIYSYMDSDQKNYWFDNNSGNGSSVIENPSKQ